MHWLRKRLIDPAPFFDFWHSGPQVKIGTIHRVTLVGRLRLPGHDQPMEELNHLLNWWQQDPEQFLDFIHYYLQEIDVTEQDVRSLDGSLARGSSVWRATDRGLVRRVEPTATAGVRDRHRARGHRQRGAGEGVAGGLRTGAQPVERLEARPPGRRGGADPHRGEGPGQSPHRPRRGAARRSDRAVEDPAAVQPDNRDQQPALHVLGSAGGDAAADLPEPRPSLRTREPRAHARGGSGDRPLGSDARAPAAGVRRHEGRW